MSIGWFADLASANDYYNTERFITDLWDELSDDGKKEALIINAYNRLYHDPDYNLPKYADATATEKIKLRIINGEMAYYLLMHLQAEDRRTGLQAQSVTEAGVIKEKYSGAEIPIPPVVKKMLEEWAKTKTHAGLINIARDEDESVNTKIDPF